jgi:hypothetical protein
LLDKVVIYLKPTTGSVPPRLRIAINGTEVFDGVIDQPKSIRHETESQDRLNITIHKTGKTKDVVDSKEPQEVLVDEVLLNGLSQHPDKFGVFNQKDNSYVKDQTIEGNEMALNGSWSLNVPIFRQEFVPELDLTQRDQFEDTKIACFGCSFTFGALLDDNQTWPYHLDDAKNYGVGGNSISAIVGTAHWYVQNFKCDRLVMLLPHVCRLQLHDQHKGSWTFIPFLGNKFEGEAKEKVKDIVMFGEPSLLFSGYATRMKELLVEINQKTDLYITSYQPDTYDMLDKTMGDVCKILPFYEMSAEFEMASDHEHPGPEHNRIFANQIRPILGG